MERYDDNKNENTLARNIRCFRKLVGLTQEEFACVLDLNRATISALESNNKVSTNTLFKIYYCFNKSKEELETVKNKTTTHITCIQLLNEVINEIDKIIENKKEGYQKIKTNS